MWQMYSDKLVVLVPIFLVLLWRHVICIIIYSYHLVVCCRFSLVTHLYMQKKKKKKKRTEICEHFHTA